MNFGEILEPSSRAFWDGFDEIEEGSSPPLKVDLEWTNCETYPEELNFFVVIEGSKVLDFAKSALLKDYELLCKVRNGKVSLYHLKAQNVIICVSEENDLNLSGITSDLLSPWLEKAKEVITVSVQPKILYKGDDLTDFQSVSFIRGINSAYDYAKELAAPNFITGVSAGVGNLRYLKNHAVSCYVIYTDSEDLDCISTEPILKLLRDVGLQCDDKYYSRFKDESHLYT